MTKAEEPQVGILVQKIDKFISTWTEKYKYTIRRTADCKSDPDKLVLLAEFSHPTFEKPVPETSLKVYFYISKDATNIADLTFKFEHDELCHKINSTIKYPAMEDYIKMHLDYRAKNRLTYFLATSFEKTRIDDPRIKMLEPKVVKKQAVAQKLEITNKELQRRPPLLPLQQQSQLLSARVSLIETFCSSVLKIYEYSPAINLAKSDLIDFFELFGIAFRSDSDPAAFLGIEEEPCGEIILPTVYLPVLKEVLVSKLIWEKTVVLVQHKIKTVQREARILAERRYRRHLDKHLSQFDELAACKSSAGEELDKYCARVALELLEERQQPALKKKLQAMLSVGCLSKGKLEEILLSFLSAPLELKILKSHYTELEKLFDRGLKKDMVSCDMFSELLTQSPDISLTDRQKCLLWTFLKNLGLLSEECLDKRRHLFYVSTYIANIIDSKDRFAYEAQDTVDCRFFQRVRQDVNKQAIKFVNMSQSDIKSSVPFACPYLKTKTRGMEFAIDQFCRIRKSTSDVDIDLSLYKALFLNRGIELTLKELIIY